MKTQQVDETSTEDSTGIKQDGLTTQMSLPTVFKTGPTTTTRLSIGANQEEKPDEAIKFRPNEIVKVMGRSYPVVGGRLRLAHECNEKLSIETRIVAYGQVSTTVDGKDAPLTVTSKGQTRPVFRAVFQATVRTDTGTFTGTGEADTDRDSDLAEAILELAETRALARALRFAGYGMEMTGAEEVSHLRSPPLQPVPNAGQPAAGIGTTNAPRLPPGYSPILRP